MLILHFMLTLAAVAQAAPEDAMAKAVAAETAKVAAEHCKARQFEAVITLEVEGKPKRSRIRMCGKDGQTDAEWVRTLKDGADKIAANPKLPQAAKDQALAAINAEIDKLTPKPATPLLAGTGDYSIPPALPTPRAIPDRAGAVAYSVLPPLAPKAASPAIATIAHVRRPVQLPMPRIGVQCLTPGDLGSGGPCLTIERDTLITLRAEGPVPAGTSLRFVRRGEVRAELQLAQMRTGQSRRLKLPIDVCSGGGGGRLDVEIARRADSSAAAQAVGELGRFDLRC